MTERDDDLEAADEGEGDDVRRLTRAGREAQDDLTELVDPDSVDEDEQTEDDMFELDQQELDELGLTLDDPHQPESG